MENIAHYLKATSEAFGVPGFQSFMTADLYENKNMGAVVTNLHALGSICQQRGVRGRTLGAKLATANHRDFTDEQLNAGKHVVGVFGLGSHASAQADAKAKLGLVHSPAPEPAGLPAERPAGAPPPAPEPPGAVATFVVNHLFGAINNFFGTALGDSMRQGSQESLPQSCRAPAGEVLAVAEDLSCRSETSAAAAKEDKSTAMAIEIARTAPGLAPPASPKRTMSELRRAFNKIEDPRIHLPGFEKPHKPAPRVLRPWAPQVTLRSLQLLKMPLSHAPTLATVGHEEDAVGQLLRFSWTCLGAV